VVKSSNQMHSNVNPDAAINLYNTDFMK